MSKNKGPQFSSAVAGVTDLAKSRSLSFKKSDQLLLQEVIWHMITERIINIGSNHMNINWPHFRLTEFGKEAADSHYPNYHNPTAYLKSIKDKCPSLDSSLIQYIHEGLNCFKSNLLFATAVMLGAASEKLVLTLLDSIAQAIPNEKLKKNGLKLLDRPNLPLIFDYLTTNIDQNISSKKLPYSVHQGSSTHLQSAFEMIRVQRNKAVHPNFSIVSKEKIFLTIQTFPAVIETTYRIQQHYFNLKSKNRLNNESSSGAGLPDAFLIRLYESHILPHN